MTESPSAERMAELRAKATPGEWSAGKTVTCDGDGCEHCWHTFDEQAGLFPTADERGPVAMAAQGEYDNAAFIAAASRYDYARAAEDKRRVAELEDTLQRIAVEYPAVAGPSTCPPAPHGCPKCEIYHLLNEALGEQR